MGGSAFSVGAAPLRTPRMLPSLYHAQKRRCQALLRQVYVHVDSPIDGPAKKDFGDIDFLVFQRRPEAPPPPPPAIEHAKPGSELMTEMAALLGAVRTIFNPGEVSSNLAIPWPAGAEDQVSEEAVVEGEAATADEKKYIQVDIRISPSLEAHRWMLFKHAHGDLWNVVGSLVRPYGLTVDDKGMSVRIREIEAVNKTRAKVHLTSDPVRVLDFLGLPRTGAHARTWLDTPFATHDALFEYAALCRVMYITPAATDAANHDEGHNLLKDLRSLKHNDRQRMRARPAFRRWIDEFVPRCRREGRFATQRTRRAELTDDALDAFGVRDEFERRREAFLRERQREHIWNGVIKTQIPPLAPGTTDQPAITARACLVKGLKRIILERDASYGVEFDEGLLDEQGFYKEDEVRSFIDKHKSAVLAVALQRQQATYLASLEKRGLLKEMKPVEKSKGEGERQDQKEVKAKGASGKEIEIPS